eukprot:6777994-Prymnesium_polylepis.1
MQRVACASRHACESVVRCVPPLSWFGRWLGCGGDVNYANRHASYGHAPCMSAWRASFGQKLVDVSPAALRAGPCRHS